MPLALDDDGPRFAPPDLSTKAFDSWDLVRVVSVFGLFDLQEDDLIFFAANHCSQLRFQLFDLLFRELATKDAVLDWVAELRADLVDSSKTRGLTNIVCDQVVIAD